MGGQERKTKTAVPGSAAGGETRRNQVAQFNVGWSWITGTELTHISNFRPRQIRGDMFIPSFACTAAGC